MRDIKIYDKSVVNECLENGFDKTEYDPLCGELSVGCSQCVATVISRTPCHERGCPNQKREQA